MTAKEMEKMMHDGAALREVRNRLGLSQEAVSRAIDVSTIMVRKVEAGEKRASDELARRWVLFLAEREADARRSTTEKGE